MAQSSKNVGNIEWRMKDGQHIELSEMETRHIRNCISMLERIIHNCDYGAASALSYATSAPDGASYAAECYANNMFRKMDRLRSWITVFELELTRRSTRISYV